jgi:hypothetical protein
VKEKAIVAFPRSMDMLFGRSRSAWMLLFSDFDENTISGWIAFVVVSLTRDAALNDSSNGERKRERRQRGRERNLQSINLMCYTHAKRVSALASRLECYFAPSAA